MGSLPLVPLELEATEAAPLLRSLCPPPKVLTCSSNGAHIFRSTLAELIVAGPHCTKHGLGGSDVPNLR